MADVAVVTACFGGYDTPQPAVPQDVEADWHYFTDNPDLDVPAPWQTAVVLPPSRSVIPSRLLGKHWKLTPWDAIIGGESYRWIVWLDASMEVTLPTFLHEAIDAARDTPVTAWKHPRRTTVDGEIQGSLTEAPVKYGPMGGALIDQGDAYVAAGFPDDLGLWACGTLVWNLSNPGIANVARLLGASWLIECERATIQDQVSLPYVAWRLNAQVGTFPVDQVPRFQAKPRSAPYIQNEWLRIWPHLRDD